MTIAQPLGEHGVARRFLPEGFRTFAEPEVAAAPYWQRGVCFNAGCGRRFEPRRDWQMFCCEGCERAFTAEARAWGHRMALPLLVHRIGKYEKRDTAVCDRTRAARRYVAHVQSAWAADRAARAASAGSA